MAGNTDNTASSRRFHWDPLNSQVIALFAKHKGSLETFQKADGGPYSCFINVVTEEVSKQLQLEGDAAKVKAERAIKVCVFIYD
jgi:hypothetical protein